MTHDLSTELAESTLALCRIPSETGNEARIADLMEERCRRAVPGAEVRRIGNSVVCIPPATTGGAGLPTVALVGHLDTVRCAERQRYEIADGRVYGCGASDMKAGVATMLALLERHRELTAARPVWIFYDREEGPFDENGLEPVLQSGVLPPIDLAFVLEPTDRTLQLGCMGVVNARVRVHGKRAHSARPWQGESALTRAIPLLERLAGLERREVRFGELVFYEVTTATQAATYNSPNVVPDVFELNLNCRFAPGRTVDDAVREVQELVGAGAEVEIRDAAPAGTVHLDHPLLSPWRDRERLPVAPKQAWTDVARLDQHGIPAVNFGPGETAQAHQADEWCSIDSLVANFEALHRFFASKE
jgi:succinyl-diaminopimelate desuccinylase